MNVIEGQLHYVSLDLAPSLEESGSHSPRAKSEGNSGDSPTQQSVSGFTYAQIDFVKSEGLKQNNAKVKH